MWGFVWRSTWGLLVRPWVWRSFAQTLAVVVGVWAGALLLLPYVRIADPTPTRAPSDTWLWGAGAALAMATAVLPWVVARFYDRLAAALRGPAAPGAPRAYWRGAGWLIAFSAYAVGWIGVGIVLGVFTAPIWGVAAALIGASTTLPFLVRWFGALFVDQSPLGTAMRQTFRVDHYTALVVGALAPVGAVIVVAGVGWGVVALTGHGHSWFARLSAFISSDIVLDLAMSCWYMALYWGVRQRTTEASAARSIG